MAVLFIVLMTACFAALDIGAKLAGAFAPVVLALWVRYCVQSLGMTALWAVWLGRRAQSRGLAFVRTGNPRFQLLRGLLLLTCSALSFTGVRYMPVAEFSAIAFLTPFVATVLAARLLGERVTPVSWALIALGFVGALIVIRPGTGVLGWPVLFPLGLALAYGSFQALTRRLSAEEDPYATHFFTGWVGTLLLTPVLWWAVPQPLVLMSSLSAGQWALLLGVGLCGTVGHFFLIQAYNRAPAASLAPFTYTQLAFVALGAGWVFGQWPDAFGWTGMAVIAVAGVGSALLGQSPNLARQASSQREG